VVFAIPFGSDEGAENWAVLASLIETCKLHGVNPEVYFTDVLTKLVNTTSPTAASPNSSPGLGTLTPADPSNVNRRAPW
jgi:transposase IS66-like protein